MVFPLAGKPSELVEWLYSNLTSDAESVTGGFHSWHPYGVGTNVPGSTGKGLAVWN